MTIDGTNISTFGLIVQKVSGYNNLPSRKRILTEQAFLANDITHNENTVTVKLFGQYASNVALETGVNGLKALLESDVEHDFVFATRGLTFTAVAKSGMPVKLFRLDASIVLVLGVVV